MDGFIEPLSEKGRPASETLGLMDKLGSPATVASNGPNYFGFVIGATLPVSAALSGEKTCDYASNHALA